MRTPFYLKVAGLFSAVILVGFAVSGAIDHRRQRTLLREGYARQAEAVAATLTPTFIEPLVMGYVGDPDQYRETLRKVVAANENLAAVDVLLDDGARLLPPLPGETPPVVAAPLRIVRPISLKYAAFDGAARTRPIGWVELVFDASPIDRALGEQVARSLRTAALFVAMGAAASLLLARGVTAPVGRLSLAMRRIDAGDLGASVPADSRDEIGDLGRAFNQMVEGLRAKRELIHYVSRSAWEAAHRRATGAPEAAGARRTLTVLFADIVEFTPLAGRLPAGEVVGLLNRYFDEMVRVVLRHGGTIDKFIGDAVMAVFEGAGDGAGAALAAAREMQVRLAEMRALGDVPFRIRVGVNTGEVVVGDIGSIEHRRDFTSIGETVNLAARLCDLCPPDAVHIGAETHRRLDLPPEAERRTGVRARGIDRDLETYVVR